MKYVLSSKQMKQVDDHSIHYIGIPSVVLMERAALAVADEFLNMKTCRSVFLIKPFYWKHALFY